jgi:hypothetical protein
VSRLVNGASLALACAALAFGCAKKQELVTQTAADKELTARQIDDDPLALLPGGAIGAFYVDTQKLFASELGQKLLAMARARAPLPDAAGFDPARDLKSVYVGSYSMQGADVAAVLTGTFDREKIEKTAESTDQTALGAPVVKSTYAGRTLYTSRNVGFVVLTERTVLAGNETGIRRTLDRIKEGRVKRELPEWMSKLLLTKGASAAGGVDLRSQPVSDAARAQLPFLNELETARMLGNFESPGLNIAGTLTYTDEAAAQRGAESVRKLHEMLQNYRFLMAIIGIAQPVQKLEAEAAGKDTRFVVGLDGQAIVRLLEKAEQFLGLQNSSQPVPATLSPGVTR